MTIADGSNIKIYKQKKKVTYADYKSGFYYISPHECMIVEQENQDDKIFNLNKTE